MAPRDLNEFAYGLAKILAVLVVIVFLLALSGVSLSSPPAWLVDWTDWLVSAVTVVFAPIVLVTTAQALRKWANM